MGTFERTLDDRVRDIERALYAAPKIQCSSLGLTALAEVIADLLRGRECDKLQIVEKEVRRLLKVTP